MGVKFFFLMSAEVKLNKVDGLQVLNLLKIKSLKKRKKPIHRTTRITSTRFTATPRTRHQPTKLTPIPVTVPQPTQLTPRRLLPTTQSVSYTSHQMKVYTRNEDEDQTFQVMLPPTTTALVVKKPVR